MAPEQWLGLGLDEAEHALFEAGGLRTVEAADAAVVGIPRDGGPCRRLADATSREEAVVIATILRMFNPI